MWYLIGLGSNIAPAIHLPKALCMLADEFGWVWVSRIGVTEPVGMATRHRFLNAVACLWSPLDSDQLKQQFNAIEASLGRDRSDPDRAHKDRTIDLDILDQARTPIGFRQPLEECYYSQVLEATGGNESPAGFRVIRVEVDGAPLGQSPATIYRNRGGGHEVIVDEGQ